MRILITGTTGGIGSAIKSAAISEKHEVVEVNRDSWEEFLSSEINVKFDAVVFATGTCPIRPLSLIDEKDFDETMRVNTGLFFRLVRKIVRDRLYSDNGTSIVAISSVSATHGWAGGAEYCASKGALSALCRSLNEELRTKKISVAALEPGYIKTKMFFNGAARMGVSPCDALDPEEFAKTVLSTVSLPSTNPAICSK